MRKTLFLSTLALCFALLPAWWTASAAPRPALAPTVTAAPAPGPELTPPQRTETVTLLTRDGRLLTLPLEDYVKGVVAAEMPVSFAPEALKAQAVAARTYALYCAEADKHGEAQVCTEPGCCQAYRSEEELKEQWAEDYDKNLEKLSAAVLATEGQVLRYGGELICAAFHSSSSGATEDCAEVWSPQPYLTSVSSPETAEDVPNYVTLVYCWPLDLRDAILSRHPEADFSGEESSWLGRVILDGSGRVKSAALGGVELAGTELRALFGLRSTAFTLSYSEGIFCFKVTGFGHGIGMSQYGAEVMAREGLDYGAILAHYYPGTVLSGL